MKLKRNSRQTKLNPNKNIPQVNYRIPSNRGLHRLITYFHYHLGIQAISIALTLLIMLLIAIYFITPLNMIQRISVQGNRTIPKNIIVKNLKAEPGNSLSRFHVHNHNYKNHLLKRYPKLKKIRINFSHWNHVHVSVSEYHIVAYLRENKKYYLVIPNGKVASQTHSLNGNYPILTHFSKSYNLKSFVNEYNKMPSDVKSDVHRISFSPTSIDPDRIRVFMNDGNQIFANFETWGTKMKYYPTISKMMKKKGIINLEVGVCSYNKSGRKISKLNKFGKISRVH